MSRTAIVVWLLAVSCTDRIATKTIQNISVSLGQDVMLPCPCSEDTKKLIWQIGEEIVVNHCCQMKDPVNKSYVNRTKVFLSFTKGNCSLLLHHAIMTDMQTFTCYILDGEKNLQWHKVELKFKDVNQTEPYPLTSLPTQGSYTGFSVGVPLSLMLVLLGGLIVALVLMRKHKQRRLRMVVVQDPQA
ncbi:uncharacterized protein si:dkey-192g7.3 isoform X2 [Neoarius graeffei]|uniref:uncharacterized protein si:dkey-192g7.3 isoform X2 n=1 Tax=Neoarius graeffei TaxID=443677 RepID=UPI00298CC4D4|nr:uncharacterized protein si:dkey-192g7.3 isoform X2 [Neoarius graeffei]